MSVDFRDILAFLAVARSESYSRASAELHLAQSALSRRVLRLEQSLGVALLERHPRGVRATEAGRLLMGRAAKVDLELQQIEHDIRALRGTSADAVHVAMPQGAARLFTSPVVARFRSAYPAARLHIFERESASNQQSALKGEVAFALAYDAKPHSELILTSLLVERIFVIAPAETRGGGAYPPSFDLEELARLPLILPGRPHGYRSLVEQAIGTLGLTPNIILEVNGFATSLAMVQQGLGFTISTYPPVQSSIEAGLFVGIPIASGHCEVELSLVHRADAALPPMLQALKAIIEEVSAGIEPSLYARPANRWTSGAAAMPN
jgi:LysR family nitrogen assimilation transcriptional regulator